MSKFTPPGSDHGASKQLVSSGGGGCFPCSAVGGISSGVYRGVKAGTEIAFPRETPGFGCTGGTIKGRKGDKNEHFGPAP